MKQPEESQPRWTEAAFLELLSVKHSAPAWVFIPKVPDAPQHAKTRTADALAFGAWKSVGLHAHGFEIKCNRGDWRREMQDHTKAMAFAPFCHFWWIVAPPKVVDLIELPETWGLLEPRKSGGLIVRKQASFVRKPEPFPFDLMVSCMRKFLDERSADMQREYTRGRNSIREELQTFREEQRKAAPTVAMLQATVKSLTIRAEAAETVVDRFHEATGVRLHDWAFDKTAAKFKLAMNREVDSGTLERISAALATAAKELKELGQ